MVYTDALKQQEAMMFMTKKQAQLLLLAAGVLMLLFGLWPVSYTHLDVYKRQLPGNTRMVSTPPRSCTWMSSPAGQMPSSVTVSYTHLDVYKRQAQEPRLPLRPPRKADM